MSTTPIKSLRKKTRNGFFSVPIEKNSIQRRLVVSVVLLVFLCAGAVSGATLIAAQHLFMQSVDDNLTRAGTRAASVFQPNVSENATTLPPGPTFLTAPGQSVGTLGALVENGRVVNAAIIVETNETAGFRDITFNDLQNTELGTPSTIELPEIGDYRVLEVRYDADTLILVGLPLKNQKETLEQLVYAAIGITVAALGGAVSLTVLLMRRALLPLTRLSEVARRVSRKDLTSGPVSLSERVGGHIQETQELREVGSAFNKMLDNVEGALQVRSQSEEKLRQFVSDASHELRTPIAVIRGYTELIQSTGLPPAAEDALKRVQGESIRMGALVEDLLLLARLEENNELETELVDMCEIVKDATRDASVADPKRQYTYRVAGEAEVLGDPHQLHQVVANLLGNVKAHTPEGTRVEARVYIEDTTVLVDIEDNGPGVPEGLQNSVFERFRRADKGRVRKSGSTGLGLAIVRSITRAHGGDVVLASKPGKTVFSIRLPLLELGE